MSGYSQQLPRIGLALKKGTEDVPDDGRFHVLVHGEVRFSSASKQAAEKHYSAFRAELIEAAGQEPEVSSHDPAEALRRARADEELQAVRSDSFERRMKLGWKKGGRGGRGGV